MDQLELDRLAKLQRLCRHDCTAYFDDCGNRRCSRCDAFVRKPARQFIEEMDQALFDAGVMLLSARTKAAREAVGHKITEARVEPEKLRARFT